MYIRVKEMKELAQLIEEHESMTGKTLINLTKMLQRLDRQREMGNEWQRNYNNRPKLNKGSKHKR